LIEDIEPQTPHEVRQREIAAERAGSKIFIPKLGSLKELAQVTNRAKSIFFVTVAKLSEKLGVS
jgi:hypothetical protein